MERSIELEKELYEECGVFGIYSPGQHLPTVIHNGLLALQNRGQEGAGIAVSNGSEIICVKDVGKVDQVFNPNKLGGLPDGLIGIGHVRYGTKGTADRFRATQPFLSDIALGHNGHIENARIIAENYGIVTDGLETDSELAHSILSSEYEKSGREMRAALNRTLPLLEGSFSFVIINENSLFGARDRNGIRPLVLGETEKGGYVLASEHSALRTSGATYIRDIEPGEAIQIDQYGTNSWQWTGETNPAMCAFEGIYFSRNSNFLYSKSVKSIRREMGRLLAEKMPVEANLVTGVPNTGIPAAVGYSHVSGIPFDDVFEKNEYVGRSFIQANQSKRIETTSIKLSVQPEDVKGKDLVVVDDSIIKGITTKTIIEMLREAGANKIHMRISSAPYKWPCFYGMDTGRIEELIASKMSKLEIQEYIGADSLAYLDTEDIRKAFGPIAGKMLCMACMDSNYPTPVPVELTRSAKI